MDKLAATPSNAPTVAHARPTVARRWLSAGLDLVFPPACVDCHMPLESSVGGMLCAVCRAELVAPPQDCPRCGSSGLAAMPTGGCVGCRDKKFHFERVVRLGPYDGALRSAVLRIKHAPEQVLAMALGNLLAETCREQLIALEADAVVRIPMHWSRRMFRGTNSPETIAEQVGRSLGIPSASHLLGRRRRTAPQANLPPTRRRANVRNAFVARRHADLPGARLLLIDDIMTTGATVSEVARTLRRVGAAFVAVAVLARAEGLG